MSWKLVFGLSILGLATAIASVLVIPGNVEHLAWLGVLAVSAIVIAKRAPGRYFAHGFLVSIVNAVWATSAHVALFDRYVALHARLALVPVHVGSPQVTMAVLGAAAGIAAGVVLGLLAWVASAFLVSSHSEFAGW